MNTETSNYYTKEERKAIADEILRQIGGNQFIAITGSRDFIYGEQDSNIYLDMRLARNKKGYKKLRITLKDDLYEMWFFSYDQTTITKEEKHEMVYDDMLQDIFTSVTGLYTHL